MHDARSQRTPDCREPTVTETIQERGDQRASVRSCAWMNDHSRRLVHYGDVSIFVQKRQRNIFWLDARQRRRRDLHRDLLAGFHMMRRLFRNAAHEDSAFVNERLYVSAAHVRKLCGEKTIEALPGLRLGHKEFATAGCAGAVQIEIVVGI